LVFGAGGVGLLLMALTRLPRRKITKATIRKLITVLMKVP